MLQYNQEVTEFQIGSSQYDQIFESFPGSVFCKDKQGTYIEVNKIQKFIIGAVKPADILGKKDSHLIWHEQAAMLLKNDSEVIYTEKPKVFIESCSIFDNTVRTFISKKFPLRNKSKKILGMLGMSFLLDDTDFISAWLNKSGFFINATSLSKNMPINNNNLSDRQMECLYYLVKGMTMKQIAKTLNLAPKTIEHHIEAIKNKLNCRSRYELVSKALNMSYIMNRL